MSTETSVVLVEFNELTPTLIHEFIDQGHLPNFKRMFEQSHAFTSDAKESGLELNPWVQWVTVHSGMSLEQHGVTDLAKGYKLEHPCVWDIVSRAGLPIWVCGSMNVRYDPELNGEVLPDPWCTTPGPTSKAMMPFYRLVVQFVQEHTNDHVPLSKADYAKFLMFMLSHGLSFSTLQAITRQLAGERMGGSKWKRAVILDQLLFDVFRWYQRKLRPRISTYFSNSTAHYQHVHWREMDPEKFKVKPSAKAIAEYESAILFGYQQHDKLMGRFLDTVDDNTVLIFCSALGQQPCTSYESEGGKQVYRPRKFDPLFEFADLPKPHTVRPVMSQRFEVVFENESDACEGAKRLRTLRAGDAQAMNARFEGCSVRTGCMITNDLPKDTVLTNPLNGKSCNFFDLFYSFDTIKSGMHHPDGILWIRMPDQAHHVYNEKVELTSIAPTILELLDVKVPEQMRGGSLIEHLQAAERRIA